MPIPNYNDDVAMAEYGRYCAKWKAIREAKEMIRDCAVRIGNSTDVSDITVNKASFDDAVTKLLEALAL